MIRRDWRIGICILMLVLNLSFIWGNSLLPAEVSQSFSDWVADIIPELPTQNIPQEKESGILRKIAHFTEFASLGLLLAWLAVLLGKPWRYLFFAGVLAASADEIIQMFVPGRGPAVLDVLIDTSGLLTGMLLLKIGYLLFTVYQSKQHGGKQT